MTHIHVHVIWPESFLQVCKKKFKNCRAKTGRHLSTRMTSVRRVCYVIYQLSTTVWHRRCVRYPCYYIPTGSESKCLCEVNFSIQGHRPSTCKQDRLYYSYFPAITNEGEKSLFEVQFWYTHDFYYHHFSNIKYSQFSNLYTFTRN